MNELTAALDALAREVVKREEAATEARRVYDQAREYLTLADHQADDARQLHEQVATFISANKPQQS